MKKLIIIVVAFLSSFQLKADEGMWLLMLINRLNYVDMQKEGLNLTAEEIYSVNHSSIKDAIINFGDFCTGEMISSQGLILTNHHCGYDAIAELSTEKSNYLKNGFWAYKKSQELKPKKLSVKFFKRMEDVTKRVLDAVGETKSEEDRQNKIDAVIEQIKKENSENGKFIVNVKDFFKGNEFYMFVYQEYTDVRLVGAPPSSIGKFGGDTDNWEWPRHTGDFSMFRVYADKDGKPAKYSKDNIPLKPNHHFPVSLKGVQEGDFAMIFGYPGGTDRYMPSWGVAQAINYEYPAWVESSKTALDVMKKYMDKSESDNINYASSYSGIANYWKNRIGMIKALTEHKTIGKKEKIEKKFKKWAKKRKQRKEYGQTLDLLKNYYEKTNDNVVQKMYLRSILNSSNIFIKVFRTKGFLNAIPRIPKEALAEAKKEILPKLKEDYSKMNIDLEKEILATQLKLYFDKVKDSEKFEYINEINSKTNGDFKGYVDKMFELSIFSSFERIENFVKTPDMVKLQSDEFANLVGKVIEKYREESPEMERLKDQKTLGYRLFVKGLREMNSDKVYYPDANFSPRLTYGKVRSLPFDEKNDAKTNFYTTLKGTLAKYKEGDAEFDLPKKMFDLYEKKDFGQYADKAGHLPVCFLTDNDITGGNSGSPTINGDGQIIGTAFDGNWEAMSGDIEFDKDLQRTIVTDIRYVMFIVDKYAGAKNIIEELTIVK